MYLYDGSGFRDCNYLYYSYYFSVVFCLVCVSVVNSIQSHLFSSLIGARTLKMLVPYSPPNVMVNSSWPDYLHADASDGGDLSFHQQEVTDEQLVTDSLM